MSLLLWENTWAKKMRNRLRPSDKNRIQILARKKVHVLSYDAILNIFTFIFLPSMSSHESPRNLSTVAFTRFWCWLQVAECSCIKKFLICGCCCCCLQCDHGSKCSAHCRVLIWNKQTHLLCYNNLIITSPWPWIMASFASNIKIMQSHPPG